MTPLEFLNLVIVPGLEWLPEYDSPEARCLLLAIAGHESNWTRRHVGHGGAGRSFWCIERDGLLKDALCGPTATDAIRACRHAGVDPGLDRVYAEIGINDELACCMARLILARDSGPPPPIGKAWQAWHVYVALWHPRAPLRSDEWLICYAAAAACFKPQLVQSGG